MRGCLVTVSTFKELKLVQTARRLFQRTDYAYDAAATQDMTRRFVEGYKILHAQATAAVEESASKGGRRPSLSSNAVEELGQLKKRIELYRDKLSSLGISDAQVCVPPSTRGARRPPSRAPDRPAPHILPAPSPPRPPVPTAPRSISTRGALSSTSAT